MQTFKTSSFAVYKVCFFLKITSCKNTTTLITWSYTDTFVLTPWPNHLSFPWRPTRNIFAEPAPWRMNKASASVRHKQNSPVQVCSRCTILLQFLRITHNWSLYFHHHAFISYNNLLEGKNPNNHKKQLILNNNKKDRNCYRRPDKLLRNSSHLPGYVYMSATSTCLVCDKIWIMSRIE